MMALKHSYTLIAPFYDGLLARASRDARKRSLAALQTLPPSDVLIDGVGTGLDVPYLARQHRYVGLDMTPAMLRRCVARTHALDFHAVQADAQRLPFADDSFDVIILHLIIAVVPNPRHCLQEATRVLRPGGTMLLFDKFLRPQERATWRRLANRVTRRVATSLDVVFEHLLETLPELDRVHDEPALASGWFRLIRLRKRR